MYDFKYYFPDNHYPYGWQISDQTQSETRVGYLLVSDLRKRQIIPIRRLCSPQVVDILVHAKDEVLQEGDSEQLYTLENSVSRPAK